MSKVHDEVMAILSEGIPKRVLALSQALRQFYQTPELSRDQFAVR